MIMSTRAIDEFEEQLVRLVRDDTIRSCDMTLKPDYQGADGKRWRASAAAAGGHVPAEMAIPDCVDSAVAHVLGAMDDAEMLHLSFTTTWGETVDLSVVGWGEPVGYYGVDDGWRGWYSKERMADIEDWANRAPLEGTEKLPPEPPPVLEELSPRRRAIEELGQLLVRHVRDVAIRSCDHQLTPQSDTPVARRWRQAALESGGAVPLHVLIPDCVDETILAFLRAIDEGLLPLSFTAASGETVNLREAGGGKLAERYVGKDGWRAKYTKERFINEITNRAPE
jgi:hypothetical protein